MCTQTVSAQVVSRIYTEDDLRLVELPEQEFERLDLGLVVYLQEKNVAPYSGYLLDTNAVANIVIRQNFLLDSSQLALNKQRALDLAFLNLEVSKISSLYDAENKKHQIILDGKDKDIRNLQSINKELQQERNDIWGDILLGGSCVGAGLLVGIIVGFIAGSK